MKIGLAEIDRMTEAELLKVRLCDLDLQIEDSSYFSLIQLNLRKLESRALLFQPYFWLSTEWFCPDGTMGIAIPFYLMHQKLYQLEKKYTGVAEGRSPSEFQKILLHEFGHACDNAYGLRRSKERVALFGSSKRSYPFDYQYQLYSRNYVKNLGWGYAQSHPDEDLAETFAVWMQSKSCWKKAYAGTKAFDKLIFLDQQLQHLRGKPPIVHNNRKMDTLNKQKMTLLQYYSKKRRYYKNDKFKIFDPGLKRILPRYNSCPSKSTVGRSFLFWRKQLSKQLNYPLYKTDLILKGVFARSQDLRRAHPRIYKRDDPRFLDFLLAKSRIYVQKGYDRVIL
jgi:hypothetical protein